MYVPYSLFVLFCAYADLLGFLNIPTYSFFESLSNAALPNMYLSMQPFLVFFYIIFYLMGLNVFYNISARRRCLNIMVCLLIIPSIDFFGRLMLPLMLVQLFAPLLWPFLGIFLGWALWLLQKLLFAEKSLEWKRAHGFGLFLWFFSLFYSGVFISLVPALSPHIDAFIWVFYLSYLPHILISFSLFKKKKLALNSAL